MTLSRRSLLAMLALAVADPERLIWRPGKKLISIPAPAKPVYLSLQIDRGERWGDITAIVVLDRFGHALSVHRYPPGQRLTPQDGYRFLIGNLPPSPRLPPVEGLRLWLEKSRRSSTATGRT